jgi:hypothetical protein
MGQIHDLRLKLLNHFHADKAAYKDHKFTRKVTGKLVKGIISDTDGECNRYCSFLQKIVQTD